MTRRSAQSSLAESVNEIRREVVSIRDQLAQLAAEVCERPAETAEQPAATTDDRGRAELRWLSAHIDEVAARHQGKAIAVVGEQVVASGPDMKTVVRLAREAGYPDALFTAIRTDQPEYRS